MAEKICAYCDESYVGHFNSRFCKNQHYNTCANCDVKFPIKIKNIDRIPKTCSTSCASALSHTETSKQKRKQNTLEKHGVEHMFQVDSVKSKIKKALDDNPDKDFRIGSNGFKKLIKDTHGVDNVSSLDSIKELKKQKALEKYGVENVFQSPIVQETFKATMVERYGVENPSQSEEIREKINRTMSERYGRKLPSDHKINDYENWINFSDWVKSQGRKLTIDEVSKHFNLHYYTILDRRNRENLTEYFRFIGSHREETFKVFLKKSLPEINYKRNDRSTIGPFELDFFFPDSNFAVEISPTLTHFSLDDDGILELKNKNNSRDYSKSSDYHINKALACEAAGVELFTFFDWMPWEKSLDMIRHKLSGSTERVYARKTKAHYVDKTVKSNVVVAKRVKDFINDSHILGFDGRGSQFYTYLEYDGEIVAAAGWGKPRNLSIRNLGKARSDDVIELTRLCFKSGFSVPGGASRLLKTFLRNHGTEVKQIITFSDYDLGFGNIYETLGFKLIDPPKPQLNYVHPYVPSVVDEARSFRIKNTSLHFAGADRLLSSFPDYVPVGMECVCADEFHEKGSCLPNNTEIVLSYGFLPIHDCGYKKWALNIESESKSS